jgi:CRP-like cAMP-binding protein
MIDVFEELVRGGKTIVMVTHDPSLTARVGRTIVISDGELIDEAVAAALPSLRHRHMLEITKKAKRVTLQPHEIVLEAGQPVENLYVIARGPVSVMSGNTKNSRVLAHLQAGDLFGEMELLRGGKAVACVRAEDSTVELLSFPGEDFMRIIAESPITAEALKKSIQEKLRARDGKS